MTAPTKVDVFCHALAAQGKCHSELEQMLSSLGPGVQSMSEQLQVLMLLTNRIMTHQDSATLHTGSTTLYPLPVSLDLSGHRLETKAPSI